MWIALGFTIGLILGFQWGRLYWVRSIQRMLRRVLRVDQKVTISIPRGYVITYQKNPTADACLTCQVTGP